METKIYSLNEEKIDINIIKEAGDVLKKGYEFTLPEKRTSKLITIK